MDWGHGIVSRDPEVLNGDLVFAGTRVPVKNLVDYLAAGTAWTHGEDGWWVASCLEMPEALTQGESIEEARENLKDAIQFLLEVRREDAEKQLEGRDIIRESLAL